MSKSRLQFRRPWQILFAVMLLLSQTVLLAHVHEKDLGRAQSASCLICAAAQNGSPACPNSFPELDAPAGHAPFVAAPTFLPVSTEAPAARQRSPPYFI